MRSTLTAVGLLLAIGVAAPAIAQDSYSQTVRAAGSNDPGAGRKPATTTVTADPKNQICPTKVTSGARKPLLELQTAINAKDAAKIASAEAAARGAAKNADDKCILSQMQLKAAVDRQDYVAAATAIDAMIASGVANKVAVAPFAADLGKLRYNAKDYAGASAAFERALALDPARGETMIALGETRVKQGRAVEGIALFQQGIAAEVAAGRKPSEGWYKRAVAVAYDAKKAQVVTLSRDWVAAYPSPKNWRDTIRIYESISGLSDSDLIDMMRLARATKGLLSEADYYSYADIAMTRGYPGEVLGLLNEGIAAQHIDRNRPLIKDVMGRATAKAAADKAGMEATAKAALAGPNAKLAITTGDAYFGYGDYAKAAALYRAAQTKAGVDTPLANLRLGMALTMAGDKAGAKTALSAVTGPKADIAKYWLIYLAQRP
jgi:tetratricopeptide (TPR) repeat protein